MKLNNGVHNYTVDEYVSPKDKVILEQLEWFKDQKLGLMMHFGIFSQMGIYESWPIVDEDASWARKDVDWVDDGNEFREEYFALNKSFNPVCIEPEVWADVAKKGGFRYLVFTTKHHDGFCLWDTKQTDYKITAEDCPFCAHKYADIVGNVFNAFRKKDIAIAAYFSKPDWHSKYFWAENKEREIGESRMPTYDATKEPELWQQFVAFSHNQLRELINDYGKIDILWLDGGWVEPRNHLDLQMNKIIPELRKNNPKLLVADRTVGGEYENYITPELTVPEEVLSIPWESCLNLGSSFAYRYDGTYKTVDEIVKMLIDIVCKGGNLALNVAPQPNGKLPKAAVQTILELGNWLNKYGEGIYGTRPVAPYKKDGICYTKKGDVIYAFVIEPIGNSTLHFDGNIEKMSTDGETIEAYKITMPNITQNGEQCIYVDKKNKCVL